MCSQDDAGQTPENAISCEESSHPSHLMRQIPKSLQLDAIDRSILSELQNDGRLSNVELAARVHLSPSACLRRVRTMELVNAIPGLKCFEPQGAFYIFPDVSYYYGKSDGTTTIKNSADFSMYLLNTAHVSSVMGDAFGEPACVRFSFANSMGNIEKAWGRIKDALAKLK